MVMMLHTYHTLKNYFQCYFNMKLTIPNFNNKLSADVFFHVYKTLGKYTCEDFRSWQQIEVNELPDKYIVHDIGTCLLKELPPWMMLYSHNCTIKEYLVSTNTQPDTLIHFIIFKKID